MRNATNAAGAPDTSRKGRKSGIEALEQALEGYYYDKPTTAKAVSYDDIQRFNAVGASVGRKNQVVRDEHGRIDIIATYRKAGIEVDERIIAQAAQMKGGLF